MYYVCKDISPVTSVTHILFTHLKQSIVTFVTNTYFLFYLFFLQKSLH